jgi:diguanylate cyclase (GGDEF)-like protein/PAS domain S-box-containing protein
MFIRDADPVHDLNDTKSMSRELQLLQAKLARYKQESITLRRQMEDMRENYAGYFDLLPVGWLTVDEMGRVLEINHAAASLLGDKRADLIGRQFVAWLAEDDRPRFLDCLRHAFVSHEKSAASLEVKTSSSTLHDVCLDFQIIKSADADKASSCHILIVDLSEHRKVEAAAALTSSVIDGTTEGIMITDSNMIIRSVNPAFERISGYSAHEAVGCTPALLKSNRHDTNFYRDMWEMLGLNGQWQGEVWNRHKSGEIYPVWLNITTVKDSREQVIHYVGTLSDSPSQELILERLQYLAYYDVLTGLPNRRLFLDRLHNSLSQARRDKHMVAVLFVDLDKFKQVNDTLGHKAGDDLLVCASEHMKCCLRDSDTLARFGGDEFAAILPAIPDAEAAISVARKFTNCYSRPMNLNGKKLNVSASIGISIFPDDGDDVDDLLNCADTAMYHVKEAGRNGYLHNAEGGSHCRIVRTRG